VLGGLEMLAGRMTTRARMALAILVATIPAVAFGLFMKFSGLQEAMRGPVIVAVNAVLFGLVMWYADARGPRARRSEDLGLLHALLIGAAQAVAIIPGVSRSGITMSAGRLLGLTREEAARFSFLLGIPAIAGAGILVLGEALENGHAITADALLAGALTFFVALGAIAFLMKVITRIGLMPFVIYRFVLAAVLAALLLTGHI
jgi:undecaprenyl-diphosphatase